MLLGVWVLHSSQSASNNRANRPASAVTQDLLNLKQLNPTAPYFLAVHVREYSDVGRVVEILSELEAGHGFEVVPVERFMALANAEHSYRTRFGPSGDRDDTEL